MWTDFKRWIEYGKTPYVVMIVFLFALAFVAPVAAIAYIWGLISVQWFATIIVLWVCYMVILLTSAS